MRSARDSIDSRQLSLSTSPRTPASTLSIRTSSCVKPKGWPWSARAASAVSIDKRSVAFACVLHQSSIHAVERVVRRFQFVPLFRRQCWFDWFTHAASFVRIFITPALAQRFSTRDSLQMWQSSSQRASNRAFTKLSRSGFC